MTGQQPLLGIVREPAATEEPKPTRQQCIEAAGEIYGSILADPERRAALIANRAKRAAGRAS